MQSDQIPVWMVRRPPDEIAEDRVPSKVPAIAVLLVLGTLIALGVYFALEHPSSFHLTVTPASAAMFALVVVSRIQCSRKAVWAFAIWAVEVNLIMAGMLATYADDSLKMVVTMMSVILFTGMIGLVLLARTNSKPSRPAKVAVMGAVVAMCVAGPLLYLFAPEDGVLSVLTEWFLVASIPMLILSFATTFMLSASHRSEVTLPQDKWV